MLWLYCKERKGQKPCWYIRFLDTYLSTPLVTVFEKKEERWVANVDTSKSAGDRCKKLVQTNRGKLIKLEKAFKGLPSGILGY